MAKSNDCEATLRKGTLPKTEKVSEAKAKSGVAKACAKDQYTTGKHGKNCDCPGCCE